MQLQYNFSRIDNAQAGQSYPKIKNNGFLSKKNAFRSQRPNFRTFAIARHGFGLRTYDNPIYTNENVWEKHVLYSAKTDYKDKKKTAKLNKASFRSVYMTTPKYIWQPHIYEWERLRKTRAL